MQYHIYIFTERAHLHEVTTNRAAALTTLQNAKDRDAVKMCLIYEDNNLLEAYMQPRRRDPVEILPSN